MADVVIIGAPETDFGARPVITNGVDFSVAAASLLSNSFAATNLVNGEPAETWRSSNRLPANTMFSVALDGVLTALNVVENGNTAEVTAVALGNVNFGANSAYYRLVGFTGTITAFSQELVPTGTVSSTNTESTHAAIDETTDPPGGDWATPTVSANPWDILVSFNTPTNAPVAGAQRQQFWAYIRAQGGTPNVSDRPTIKCELYESGVLVADLGTKLVNTTTGHYVFWPWNASSLGTASGANVEAKFTTTVSTSGIYVEVDRAWWRTEDAADFDNDADKIWDSGWIQYTEPTGFSGLYPSDLGAQKSVVYTHSTTTATGAVLVMVMDDHTPVNLSFATAYPTDPSLQPWVEVGNIFFGKKWSPANNFDFGDLLGTYQLTQPKYTDGGQTYGSNLPTLRELKLNFEALTPAEAHALYDRLVLRKGMLRPVFVAAIPGDATEGYLTSFPAVLANGAEIRTNPEATWGREMSFVFREKR